MLNGRAQQEPWPNNTMLVGRGVPTYTPVLQATRRYSWCKPPKMGSGQDRSIPGIVEKSRSGRIGDLLLESLMGTCAIEVGDIGVEDPRELLLMQDEQMIETLTTHAPQEALTARVGAWGMVRRLQNLDA